jgi:hypothetical protein
LVLAEEAVKVLAEQVDAEAMRRTGNKHHSCPANALGEAYPCYTDDCNANYWACWRDSAYRTARTRMEGERQ